MKSLAPGTPAPEQLAEAALQRGVQVEYFDIFGRAHQARPDVLKNILAALGPEPDAGPIPRTLVLTQGNSFSLPAQAELSLESGERRSVAGIGTDLPTGYHTLDLPWQGGTYRAHLIISPPQMYAPDGSTRAAGIAISLYSLRSHRNWGSGDLRDLYDFIDWASGVGFAFVALNPLHAIHNRQPYNTSPYLPLCSYYRNFLYLDVEAIEEFAQHEIRLAFDAPVVQSELSQLRDSEFVEYERVAAVKLKFLRLCFDQSPLDRKEFREYIKREGELLQDFALYCALDEHFRTTRPDTWLWTQWPEEYRNPRSSACLDFRAVHERDVKFFCWLQWQLDRQLARVQAHAKSSGMPIGLYHDLALATDRYGCDLWANRDHFVEGCRVGAPPDDFSPEGQDWSFPPPNGSRHLEDGYRLFLASVRNNAAHGGALRLDHVMRLFRLFWIPEGYSARDGTYVHERWRDFLGILALESHRLQVRIIGEDLGTVTDEIRDALAHYGVLGYRLLYFERENGRFRPPETYTPRAVASTTTHDLPTLTGFWLGTDIEARRGAGLLDNTGYEGQVGARKRDKQLLLDHLHQLNLLPHDFPRDLQNIPEVTAELRDASLTLLASTPCELLAINQEELTGERYQQNLPGSTSEYPNWRRKMKLTVEELRSGALAETSERLRNILRHTGRLPR